MKNDFSQTIQSIKNTADSFMDQAASSVTTESKNTLNALENLVGESRQTLSHLTTNLTQSVSGLNEATATLKTSVLEATGGAVETISQSSTQAANAFKETTIQATDSLSGATNVAVHKLNNTAGSITQTAEKTKFALDEALQKAEQLSGAISHSAQDAVVTLMKAWMQEHPVVSWIITHPLWAIALTVLVLFLCWSLLGAIAQFTQQAWLALLQAPLKLIQLLSRGVSQSLKRAEGSSLTKLDEQQDVQERLAKTLGRLEALRQEQEVLMREVNSILISKS